MIKADSVMLSAFSMLRFSVSVQTDCGNQKVSCL